MTTPLFLLRCVQLGISIRDLDLLTIGMVNEWIKSILPINLIALLLLVNVVYIGIICYVKDWLEKRGHY